MIPAAVQRQSGGKRKVLLPPLVFQLCFPFAHFAGTGCTGGGVRIGPVTGIGNSGSGT
jgi:hypothetical protein